jgi:uncharacterized protein (DUF2236 family)
MNALLGRLDRTIFASSALGRVTAQDARRSNPAYGRGDRRVEMFQDRVAAGFRRIVSGEPDGEPGWVTALAEGTDAGYFGPGSATWAVHGGLPTLVGGIRALLLQTLHPAVLAGVDEHSRYVEDPLGRLAGTTQWLTVVTFGDRAAADRESARVRGLHRRVVGEYTDVAGLSAPYRATDADLLAWVHLTFTESFLVAHRIWGGEIPGGPDNYVREWARAGESVGVVDPPTDDLGLTAALEKYDSVLTSNEMTKRTIAFICNPPLPLAARPGYRVLLAGAVASLPPDKRRLLGFPPVPLPLIRPAVRTMFAGLGWALGSSPPAEGAARARLGAKTAGRVDV